MYLYSKSKIIMSEEFPDRRVECTIFLVVPKRSLHSKFKQY